MYGHLHTYLLKRGSGVKEHDFSPGFVAFEHHAQDRRVKGPIHAAPTFGHSNANSMGVSGNNPLLVGVRVKD